MLAGFLIIAVTVGIDQLVKFWASTVLQTTGTISFIPGLLDFSYVENTGAAFSLFEGGRWVFIVITIAVLAAAAVALYKKIISDQLGKVSLYLVIGGAIGNLIDRALHGFVVDMFDFQMFGKRIFVFNVADIFITIGGILFVIYYLFRHEAKKAASNQPCDQNEDSTV